MNKFYTLICALAVTASTAFASSADLAKHNVSPVKMERKSPTGLVMKATSVNLPKAHRAGANVTATDVAGTYDWTYIDELNEAMGAGTVEITAVSDTQVKLSGLYSTLDVYATVGADGSVSIAEQEIGYNSRYDEDLYVRHFVWNPGYQGISASAEPMVGYYSNDAIIFDEDDLFMVDGKSRSTGEFTGETAGFYCGYDTFTMTRHSDDPEPDDSADWELVGTADLVDGWVYTCYGIDQKANVVSGIKLEKSLKEEGVYRLVNPFKGTHLAASVNTTAVEKGYIKFNIADPSFPYLYNGVKAGFANTNGEFYCYDLNGLYFLVGGYAKNVILSAPALAGQLSTYDPETATLTIPSAVFGVTANPDGGYSWQDSEGNSTDMFASIKLNLGNTGDVVKATTFAEVKALPEGTPVELTLEAGAVTFVSNDMHLVEDETGAMALVSFDFEPFCEAGKLLSGTFVGEYYGMGVLTFDPDLSSFSAVEDVDVSKGAELSYEELTSGAADWMLVTVTNSEDTPIVVDETGAMVGEDIFVFDAFDVLDADFEFGPMEQVTGSLIPGDFLEMPGIYILAPRSLDDIVAAAGAKEYNSIAELVANAQMMEECVLNLNQATVTFFHEFQGMSVLEDATAGLMIMHTDEYALNDAGAILSGKLVGTMWPAVFEVDLEKSAFAITDYKEVTTGASYPHEEMVAGLHDYKLVTFTASNELPITTDESGYQVNIGSKIAAVDLFDVFDDDYLFPSNIKQITGIIYPMSAMWTLDLDDEEEAMPEVIIAPRSANDVVAEESGIQNVDVDANAPVVYYNLQGIRVNNPAQGDVLIRKANGKVTKVIF